jgi:hypothetical protein
MDMLNINKITTLTNMSRHLVYKERNYYNILIRYRRKRINRKTRLFPNLVNFYKKEFSHLTQVIGLMKKSYKIRKKNIPLPFIGQKVKSLQDRFFEIPQKILLVYIKMKRRNTFTAVFILNKKEKKFELLQKFSVGLLGFLNNKKVTAMAKHAVATATGEYVKEWEPTMVDIIYPKYPKRRYMTRTFFESLIKARFFVRYLIAVKRRSFGIHRGKKQRRV